MPLIIGFVWHVVVATNYWFSMARSCMPLIIGFVLHVVVSH